MSEGDRGFSTEMLCFYENLFLLLLWLKGHKNDIVDAAAA